LAGDIEIPTGYPLNEVHFRFLAGSFDLKEFSEAEKIDKVRLVMCFSSKNFNSKNLIPVHYKLNKCIVWLPFT
jgi:hypothetical protein